MKIYDNTGKLLLDIAVNDESVRYKSISGENNLSLKFSLDEHIEIPIGSYCEFKEETYYLMLPEDLTMHHRRSFEYSVVMYTEEAIAKRIVFINPVDGRFKFPLTAKPIEHLQMFVDNMNMRGSGWIVGSCPDHVEITLAYDKTFCYDALVQLADELNLDFWFNGKEVHIGKLELNKDNPLPLSYGGDGEGFKPNITRRNYSNGLPIEKLYVQGSNVNIDPSRYGSRELHLPLSQTLGFDGIYFENEAGFDISRARYYISDNNGYSIKRADKDIINNSEDTLDCSDIEIGKIETVIGYWIVDVKKHLWDIEFSSEIDYREYQIAGETPTIIFQSGMLAGKEFEIATDKNGKIILHDEQGNWRMEICPQEIDGITMPDKDSGFYPQETNTFKFFGIQLPDEYISNAITKSGAEWDMFRAAVKYFYANEDQQFTIEGSLDEIYAKREWDSIKDRLQIGSYISFTDKSFQEEPLSIRITGIKEYINKPYSPTLEISNAGISGTLIGALNRLESKEVLTEKKVNESISFTKRRFRDAQETISMLENAMIEGFTESINPLTVQTMSMLVGAESLQFRFVTNKTNPSPKQSSLVWDKDKKQVISSGDIIQHMTLGIDTMSPRHSVDSYKFWNVKASECTPEEDGKAYFLYIKANRNDDTDAKFVLSPTAIEMESVSGYYHFLTGILNSEINGDRSFVFLNGFTEILPGQITTPIIRDSEGKLVIDLENATIEAKEGATIKGNLTLTDSQDFKDLSDNVDDLSDKQEQFDATLKGIQDQIDGVVENYFLEGKPTTTTKPVTDWVKDIDDETEKGYKLLNHVRDTYTNIQEFVSDSQTPTAGHSWRWCECTDTTAYDDYVQVTKPDGSKVKLHWHPIADSDAVKALLEARKAQDTADGKRRNFIDTPKPPYDKGDLWSDSTSGDLMVCKTARDSGAFTPTDWEKATKYTDGSNTKNLLANSGEILVEKGAYVKLRTLPITVSTGDVFTFKAEDIQKISGDSTEFLISLYKLGTSESIANGYATVNKKTLTLTIKSGVTDAKVELRLYANKNYSGAENSVRFSKVSLVRGTVAMGTWQDYQGDNALENLLTVDEVNEGQFTEYTYYGMDLPFNVNAGETYTFCVENIGNSGDTDSLYNIVIDNQNSVAISNKVLGLSMGKIQWATITINSGVKDQPARFLVEKGERSTATAKITRMSLVRGSTPLMTWKQNPDVLKNKISDWASDSKFSPTEITELKTELKRIFQEYKDVIAQYVDAFGSTSGKIEPAEYYTAYTNYYNALDTAIKNYNNLTDKTQAVSVPSSFNTYLNAYYEKKTAIITAISDKVRKDISDIGEQAAKVDDYKYLDSVFGQITEGNVMLGQMMGVGIRTDKETFTVEAFLNGSTLANDTTNGKLMLATGIPTKSASGNTDLATRAKEATSRLYEKGKFITNDIEAKGGKIGGFTIGINGLFDDTSGTSSFIRLGNLSSTGYMYLGKGLITLMSTIDNGELAGGGVINVTAQDAAFRCTKGMFYGLRPNLKVVSSDTTLTELYHTIRVTLACKLTLPGNPPYGQCYKIIKSKSLANVTIASNYFTILPTGSSLQTTFTIPTNATTIELTCIPSSTGQKVWYVDYITH